MSVLSVTEKLAASYTKALARNSKSSIFVNISRSVADHPIIGAADEMADQLEASHKAIDVLMAMLIDKTNGEFLPTKSTIWPTLEKNAELLKRIGRFQ